MPYLKLKRNQWQLIPFIDVMTNSQKDYDLMIKDKITGLRPYVVLNIIAITKHLFK